MSSRKNINFSQETQSRIDEIEKLNLEMALTRVGGFGLFQTLVTIAMGLLRNSGMPLIYMFAFIVLPQSYECRNGPQSVFSACSAEKDICPNLALGKFIEYRIDESHANFMLNWQQQMDLMCVPLKKVYLIPVIYFIMFGVGGLLTFPVMDKLGRRKTCFIFGTGNLFSVSLIMFTNTFLLRLNGFALMGF